MLSNQSAVKENEGESPEEISPSSSPLSFAERAAHFPLLYSSYFFAAWGDRMWEFAAIIFLMQIFPTSLFPSSLFGFCENVAGIALGGTVGRYIDSTDRLTVMRTSIVGQNVVIFVATIIFVVAINRVDEGQAPPSPTAAPTKISSTHFFLNEAAAQNPQNLVTLVLIVLAGMVAKVTSSMNKISIHKDWSVVLAAGDSHSQTTLNTNLRRVDLSCAILAPLAVGVLSSALSPSFALKFICCWSFASLFVELWLSSAVYSAIPALGAPKTQKQKTAAEKGESNAPELLSPSSSSSVVTKEAETREQLQIQGLPESSIYRAYLRHPIFPVSLAYCLLYISGLSFGGIMIAFLRTLGCSDALLALGRGIAALVAIGSTFAVPSMIDGLGLVNAGKLSSWLQVSALAPLAYIFFDSLVLHPTSNSLERSSTSAFIAVIFVSVCLSRFGLWAFDLCQTQLMQESVDLEYTGRVNGAQETLVNICYLISFVMTMVWDDPRTFATPALVSFGSVVLCALIFTFSADESAKRAKEMKAWVDEAKKLKSSEVNAG